jgi:UDP-glucose 4-epimerase
MSNAYGERQAPTGIQGIIPTMMDKALHRQEIRIWGDGTVIRDYIHVSDLVNAFVKSATYAGEPKIFNIGSGVGHSVNDMAKFLEKSIGRPLELTYEQGRAYDVPINILDNSLARRLLHWEAKISLEDGLRKMLEFMKEHI